MTRLFITNIKNIFCFLAVRCHKKIIRNYVVDNMRNILSSPFMDMALQQAIDAAARGEVPVGAVLVDYRTQQVLAKAGNRVEELQDATAHAEMLVMRMVRSRFLTHADLYVTLEPCPMCAAAISFARIRRLYFGAEDPKGGGVEHGCRVFQQTTCHHRPEVYGGVAADFAAGLLQKFFREKR